MRGYFLAAGVGAVAGGLLVQIKSSQLKSVKPTEAVVPTQIASTSKFNTEPGKYGLPSEENVFYRPHYVTSVNYRARIPNWVSQHLTPTATGEANRKGVRFQADDSIVKPFQYASQWLLDFT